jgi:hypothetical protein
VGARICGEHGLALTSTTVWCLLFAALAIWAGARIRMLPVGIVAALTLISCVYMARPALLVSCSCHRDCHWYHLFRRSMGSVAVLTRHHLYFARPDKRSSEDCSRVVLALCLKRPRVKIYVPMRCVRALQIQH